MRPPITTTAPLGARRTPLALGLLLALTLAAAPACQQDLNLQGKVFACQVDADCPGLVCHPEAKVCVASLDADVSALERDTAGDNGEGDGPDTVASPEPATCDAYCAAVLAACGTEAPLGAFPSEASCQTYCQAAFSDAPGAPGGRLGDASDDGGDTIGGRLHHARLAARGGPARAGPRALDTAWPQGPRAATSAAPGATPTATPRPPSATPSQTTTPAARSAAR